VSKSLGRAAWFVIGVTLLLGAAACGGGSSGSSADPAAPISVGFNDSLTGTGAAEGQADLLTAKAAIGDVNSQGGVDGHQLKLIVLDSGQVGSGQAGSNATQLAQDKVAAIIGPTISNDCDSAIPIITQDKIPDLCAFVDYNTLVPPRTYLYQAAKTEVTYAKPVIDFIKSITGKQHPRIAVIGAATQGALQMVAKMKTIAAELGASIVYSGVESLTATDLSPLGAGAIAGRPDAVVEEIFPQFVVPLDKQLRGGLPASVPIIGQYGVNTYQALQTLKDPRVYSLGGAQMIIPGASGNSAEVNALAAQFAKAGGGTAADINGAAGTEQLAADLDLFAAMKACHACTGAALAAQLQQTSLTVPGLVNDFHYSAAAHLGINTYYFYSWDAAKNQATVDSSQPIGSLSLTSP